MFKVFLLVLNLTAFGGIGIVGTHCYKDMKQQVVTLNGQLSELIDIADSMGAK